MCRASSHPSATLSSSAFSLRTGGLRGSVGGWVGPGQGLELALGRGHMFHDDTGHPVGPDHLSFPFRPQVSVIICSGEMTGLEDR